jgi:hypothetical protein
MILRTDVVAEMTKAQLGAFGFDAQVSPAGVFSLIETQ